MRLRLPGTALHEESDPKRHGRQPRTVPVPGVFADSRPGHAGQPERAPHAVVGSSGTGGHPPPGPRAGRFPLLLWHGLQQECDGGLRCTISRDFLSLFYYEINMYYNFIFYFLCYRNW